MWLSAHLFLLTEQFLSLVTTLCIQTDFLDLGEISYLNLDGAGDAWDVTIQLVRKQFLNLKAFKSNELAIWKMKGSALPKLYQWLRISTIV